MPRFFDGTDDYIETDDVNIDISGATTVAVIVRLDAETGQPCAFSHNQNANERHQLFFSGAAQNKVVLQCNTNSSTFDNLKARQANGWYFVAATKAAGTTTPNGYTLQLNNGTWTTDTGNTSIGSGNNGNKNFLGSSDGTNRMFNGAIAAVAFWSRELTESEVRALGGSYQAWFAANPDALWILDQAAITDSVIDLTGNGNDEQGRTGTAVEDGGIPGFAYGTSAPYQLNQAAAPPAEKRPTPRRSVLQGVSRGAVW